MLHAHTHTHSMVVAAHSYAQFPTTNMLSVMLRVRVTLSGSAKNRKTKSRRCWFCLPAAKNKTLENPMEDKQPTVCVTYNFFIVFSVTFRTFSRKHIRSSLNALASRLIVAAALQRHTTKKSFNNNALCGRHSLLHLVLFCLLFFLRPSVHPSSCLSVRLPVCLCDVRALKGMLLCAFRLRAKFSVLNASLHCITSLLCCFVHSMLLLMLMMMTMMMRVVRLDFVVCWILRVECLIAILFALLLLSCLMFDPVWYACWLLVMRCSNTCVTSTLYRVGIQLIFVSVNRTLFIDSIWTNVKVV